MLEIAAFFLREGLGFLEDLSEPAEVVPEESEARPVEAGENTFARRFEFVVFCCGPLLSLLLWTVIVRDNSAANSLAAVLAGVAASLANANEFPVDDPAVPGGIGGGTRLTLNHLI